MLNVEFLMRYHPQFYIGCKSTIKNRDKQKKSRRFRKLRQLFPIKNKKSVLICEICGRINCPTDFTD